MREWTEAGYNTHHLPLCPNIVPQTFPDRLGNSCSTHGLDFPDLQRNGRNLPHTFRGGRGIPPLGRELNERRVSPCGSRRSSRSPCSLCISRAVPLLLAVVSRSSI